MQNDLQIVKHKLRGFIRKYYTNQIIRGLFISGSVLLAMLLFIDFVEYYAWSDRLTRALLFYGYLLVTAYVLVRYIFIPLIRLFQLGPVISNEKAARIIGQHFPEVDDKLLNTLQLEKKLSGRDDREEMGLLVAGVRQKAAELTPIPFKRAIDFKKNRTYLKFLVPPVLLLLTVMLVAPSFVTGPSNRIIKHQVRFEKPLPYEVIILNDSLVVLQHEDYTLNLEVRGDEIPAQLYLLEGAVSYRIPEINPGKYAYIFRDVESDIYFNIRTADFISEKYHLLVRPKPVIYGINARLHYPPYLDKKDEMIENAGDLIVPEGTLITWEISTRDTRQLIFKINGKKIEQHSHEGSVFTFNTNAIEEFEYSVYGKNRFVPYADSLNYDVELIRDEYPTIEMVEQNDRQMIGYNYFSGLISDDHGFHSLALIYQKKNAGNWLRKEMRVDPDLNRQFIQYTVNAEDYGLSAGENLSFYFEVKDNDAVHGYKVAKTKIFEMNYPSEEELEKMAREKSDHLKSEMEKLQKGIVELSTEADQLRNSLYEKKDLSWMDKQQLDLLMNREKEMMDKLEEIKELNRQIDELEKISEKQVDEDLANKLDKLQRLFNELLDDDMKKEMEKMQKEMENLDKDKLADLLDQMKKNNEELKNNLDQNLEMLKQLELEQEVDELIKNLETLAEEQKKLAEKTESKALKKDSLLHLQEEVNNDFSAVEKQLEEADQLNKELQEPLDINKDEALADEVQQELDNATSMLQKGKEKKASESQENAGNKMSEMASNLSMMMENAMMARMGEDAEQVKKMMDNLLDLSFEEEKLIAGFAEVSQNDPKYMDFAERQKLIQEDYMIVHDSLIALSKRQIFIQPFIVKESGKIMDFTNKSLISMQERKKGHALGEQQYVMTSMNNLALMLEESLNQMNQSMSMMSGKPGKGKCNNPGSGSKPGLGELLQMQQQLNNGQGKSGKSKGKGSQGETGMNSEELARMAAMQGEIRRMLQDYMEQLEAEGGNGSSLNKAVEEMKKIEEDIVNRKISEETKKRQKDLEVRLLKAKEAEMERERENKRESREGKSKKRSNQIEQLEYKDNVITQQEILKYQPLEMSPYYKELLKKYLYKLERENGSQ